MAKETKKAEPKKEQELVITNSDAKAFHDLLSASGKIRGVRFGIMVNKNIRLIKAELKDLEERQLGPQWLKDKRKEIYDGLEDKSEYQEAFVAWVEGANEAEKAMLEDWESELKEIQKEWKEPYPGMSELRKIKEEDITDENISTELVSYLLDFGLLIEKQ